MTNGPRADAVVCQYNKWLYPEPIKDLEEWLKKSWQWYDPIHAHRVLWPDRGYKPDLDILIAGCGANQAAVYAYNNRSAKIVAIDVSQAAIDHHRYLKEKHALTNLELHLLPIEEVNALGQTFDLIISTGVLHHLADPPVGMKALGSCLRPEGVLAVMLYAHYGRIGVELLQSVFREIGLHQDEESLLLVKQALSSLTPSHPGRQYAERAPDLRFDSGLVDTFLHSRDRNYTVGDCLELVKSAGLVFQDWFFRAPYYPHTLAKPVNKFHAAINQLLDVKMWSVMERIKTANACHIFLACHPERRVESYKIDFSSSKAMGYIPLMRFRAGINGQEIFQHQWRTSLDQTQLAFAHCVDGKRTIRDIVKLVTQSSGQLIANQEGVDSIALELFRDLWRMDFIAIDINGVL